MQSIKVAHWGCKVSYICIILRIDTGGWSVNCCALFYKAPIKCSSVELLNIRCHQIAIK